MTGRVLFALVWVIVAAGIALPMYPRDVPTSTVAVTRDPVQLAAASRASCEDCPVTDEGRVDCPSDAALPAIFVPLEEPLGLTITITVRPHGAELSAKLPAKLPAI